MARWAWFNVGTLTIADRLSLRSLSSFIPAWESYLSLLFSIINNMDASLLTYFVYFN
jgi:hypothetical protein